MAAVEVPDIVIGRLPIYLRALNLLFEAGQEFTSSQELGQKLGIGSAQIRKDLSHFGEFGKQGTGYEINYLREQISKILHVDREWAVALVGFGDLGQAVAHYGGFASKGFHIEAIFDNDPAKIGQKTNGKEVLDIRNLAKIISKLKIKMAIIAVPASTAQAVSDILVEAGIRAILNYAPITLTVPENVQVQYIDPVVHLQRMTYYLI
ncbi:MAG TPA: redox-sensing transcriptional repressor Rex [Anaerolineae bacterium]|nr:redox-sensing transcriptional repressor Rex [Anaerolineae bacterium]